jgi:hypothetical protein
VNEPRDRPETLNFFAEQIAEVLSTNNRKEYGETYATLSQALGTGYVAGVICEKAIRFNKQPNRKDLVKIAAYAFLEFETRSADDNLDEDVSRESGRIGVSALGIGTPDKRDENAG